jgi:hypothetical protein
MKRKTRRKPSARRIKPSVAKTSRAQRGKLSQAKVAHDIATASAETIAHRATLIGQQMANPAALRHPEVATMTFEKFLVAGQMATGMMRKLGNGQRLWADFWFQQMQRSLAALPHLAGNPSPMRMAQIATDSAGTMMADYASFWIKATNFADVMANAGATPIHRAVLANAKRLSRAA